MDAPSRVLHTATGSAGTVCLDFKGDDTTDLFAVMNLATGQVLTPMPWEPNSQGRAGPFRQIDAKVPELVDATTTLGRPGRRPQATHLPRQRLRGHRDAHPPHPEKNPMMPRRPQPLDKFNDGTLGQLTE